MYVAYMRKVSGTVVAKPEPRRRLEETPGRNGMRPQKRPARALALVPFEPELAYIVPLSMDWMSARTRGSPTPERRLNIAGAWCPSGTLNDA